MIGKIKVQIRALFDQGYTKRQMAEELGISIFTIRNYLYRMDLKRYKVKKTISQDKIDRIKVLIQFNNGSDLDYSHNDVADDLGITINEVKEAIRVIEYERARNFRKHNRGVEG